MRDLAVLKERVVFVMRYGHQSYSEVVSWPMTRLDWVARVLSEQNEAMTPDEE